MRCEDLEQKWQETRTSLHKQEVCCLQSLSTLLWCGFASQFLRGNRPDCCKLTSLQ